MTPAEDGDLRPLSLVACTQSDSGDDQTEGQSADDLTHFQDESRSRSARPSRRSGTLNTLLRPVRGAWSGARSAISDWPRGKHLDTAADSLIDYANDQSLVDTALSCQWPEGELVAEKNAAYKALLRASRAVRVMIADGTKYITLAEEVIKRDGSMVGRVWKSMGEVRNVIRAEDRNAGDRDEVSGS